MAQALYSESLTDFGNLLCSGKMSTKTHSEVDNFIDDLYENVVPLIEEAGVLE